MSPTPTASIATAWPAGTFTASGSAAWLNMGLGGALALDMYGDGKQAHHPEEAGKFATEVNQNSVLTQARFDAALDLLKHEKTVDATNIAAVGYCFGGSVAAERTPSHETNQSQVNS